MEKLILRAIPGQHWLRFVFFETASTDEIQYPFTPKASMPPILIFDVNETLLDLGSLDPHFERAFGTTAARQEWFAQLLQTAFATTILGNYSDFGVLGRAALEAVAARRNQPLSDPQRAEIFAALRTLPAFPDVKPGLERLRQGGFRLAALTNSAPAMVDTQLANAGLLPYFERVFSVDAVRRYKPAPEPYRMAAAELGVLTSDLLMVAAHAWDVAGAMAAGCGGAFISRPGKVLDATTPQPTHIASDIADLASRLCK